MVGKNIAETGVFQGLDAREKMQKERLQDDFTRALNSFQKIQTDAAQKEKADLAAARWGPSLSDMSIT